MAFICLVGLVGLLSGSPAHATDTVPGWMGPTLVIPRATTPVVARNPLDGSVSIAAASGAWGMIVVNDNFASTGLSLKIGDGGSDPDLAFDDGGTLYVVWTQYLDNNPDKPKNIMVRRIQNGALAQLGERPLNLTHVLWNDDRDTRAPALAYSPTHHTLCVVIKQQGAVAQDPFVAHYTLFAACSPQAGTTSAGLQWSAPEEVGQVIGYSPAPPTLMTDTAGRIHLFYGQQDSTEAHAYIYTRVWDGAGWGAVSEITGGTRTRAFEPKVAAAPNGDVWAAWQSDPQGGIDSHKELAVARWDHQTAQWQHVNRAVGGEGVSSPAITVDSTGRVWLFWADGDNFDRLLFSTSTDLTGWAAPRVLAVGRDISQTRIRSAMAVAGRGEISLYFSAFQTNPAYAQDDSVYRLNMGERAFAPPAPTPNPSPLPFPTLSPLPTVPGEPTPTSAPRPTATPSVPCGGQGDPYEPDGSTVEAVQHTRFLAIGGTEQHTLCDPTSDHGTDVDTVLIPAVAGQHLHLDMTLQHFPPDVRIGMVGDSAIVRTTNCNGDFNRICAEWTATTDATYYARISALDGGWGNVSHHYSISLSVGDTPVTATPTGGDSATAPPTSNPAIAAVNAATPLVTPSVPRTSTAAATHADSTTDSHNAVAPNAASSVPVGLVFGGTAATVMVLFGAGVLGIKSAAAGGLIKTITALRRIGR